MVVRGDLGTWDSPWVTNAEQDERAAAHRHVVERDPVDLDFGVVHGFEARPVTSHITGKIGRGSHRSRAAARRGGRAP